MNLAETGFPPLISPVRLREREDAFARAIAEANSSEAKADGRDAAHAGRLYYVGGFELVEFAIVLEPEEPLSLARKIFFAGMNALGDALAAFSPPEKAVAFHFPGAIFFDGALIGGARLAWPEACGESEVPDWLVFGAMLRAGGMRDLGIGLAPGISSLDDEGFDPWNAQSMSASFSRHFLVEVDQWGESGFARIGPRYLSRLEAIEGVSRRGIDRGGDLLLEFETGERARRDFVAGLRAADWYDGASNAPRGF